MDKYSDDLNMILMRLLEVAVDLGRYQQAAGADLPSPASLDDETIDVARAGLVGVARRLVKEADARVAHFPDCVSHDPVWPMLLDLYIRASEQRKVTVSDACIASRAPATTAQRWITDLVERGVILRTSDPADRRRSYVTLSADAFAQMSRYLAGIAGISSVAVPAGIARTLSLKRR